MFLNILYLFLFGLTAPLVMSKYVQFYRRDYKYIKEFDAFYKLHWDLDGLTWGSAFAACDNEGAKLFYPKTETEWTVVQNLTDNFENMPNVTDVYVGIHNEFDLGEFITLDGNPTLSPLTEESNQLADNQNCVIMNMSTGKFRKDSCDRIDNSPALYVCKKLEDITCPTIDHDYVYQRETNKCYKVHETLKTWQEAMNTCFMEGAMLTVVEDKAEADVIQTIIIQDKWYFIGFRKMWDISPTTSTIYYTVTGTNIEKGHYLRWYDSPNENCGAARIYSNNLYTWTANCTSKLPFICEMNTSSNTK